MRVIHASVTLFLSIEGRFNQRLFVYLKPERMVHVLTELFLKSEWPDHVGLKLMFLTVVFGSFGMRQFQLIF